MQRHAGLVVGGIGLGLAAALTMANGALALLCVAFTCALAGWRNRPALFVTVAGVMIFAGYALTFAPHPGHTPLGFSLAHPFLVAGHLATYLGAIFAAVAPTAAAAAGIVAMLGLCAGLLGLAAGYVARNHTNVALVSIMLFVAATALLTALGRSSFGIEQASASRYCATSAVYWAALICLSTSIVVERFDKVRRDVAVIAVVGGMTASVLVSIAITQHRYRSFAQTWDRKMLQATAALLIGAADTPVLKAVYPDLERLGQLRSVLMARQLSIFAAVRPWALGTMVGDERIMRAPDACAGQIEKIEALPDAQDGIVTTEGWSWNPPASRPFERLVFVSETGAVFGYAMTVPAGWTTKLDASAPDRIGSRWYGYMRGGPVRLYGILPGEDRLCVLASALPRSR